MCVLGRVEMPFEGDRTMANDFFLKIDGIAGESQDAIHKGEIQLESFSWGTSQSGTSGYGGGAGAGKVQMQDFNFLMKHSKASPKLMLACASGEHIRKAVLTARKAGGQQQEYMQIILSDVLVSSYGTTAHTSGDEIPIDQISLNISKVEYEYKAQKSDGTLGGAIKTGYDVKVMKKV